MKYKYLILILLCLSLQSREQAVADNSTVDNITTSDKYVLKTKEESGVIKAQQGNVIDWNALSKRANEEMYEKNRQADQRYFKRIEEEEAARKAAEAEARATAILTYGTIGIVLLFFVATIVVFYILYTRRNKDNPYINKN